MAFILAVLLSEARKNCVYHTDQTIARGAGGAHSGEVWRSAGRRCAEYCAGAAAEDRDGRGGVAGGIRIGETAQESTADDCARDCDEFRRSAGDCADRGRGGGLFECVFGSRGHVGENGEREKTDSRTK